MKATVLSVSLGLLIALQLALPQDAEAQGCLGCFQRTDANGNRYAWCGSTYDGYTSCSSDGGWCYIGGICRSPQPCEEFGLDDCECYGDCEPELPKIASAKVYGADRSQIERVHVFSYRTCDGRETRRVVLRELDPGLLLPERRLVFRPVSPPGSW